MGSVEDNSFKPSRQQDTKPRASQEGEKWEGCGAMVERVDRYCLMLNTITAFRSSSFVSQRVFSNVKMFSVLAMAGECKKC